MPSFSDSIFLFVLALLLFGPKRLPVLARELGKWVGEFRRASNEFKMQMEEELRITEQNDRQKKIAAMEAAAPVTPPIAEPEHPHLPALAGDASGMAAEGTVPETTVPETTATETASIEAVPAMAEGAISNGATVEGAVAVREPLPIATSGEMRIMPPATGLPVPRDGAGTHGAAAQSSGPRDSALKGLLGSIPPAAESAEAAPETETIAHGD